MSRETRSTSKATTSNQLRIQSIALTIVGAIAFFAITLLNTGCTTATDRLERRLKVNEPVTRLYAAKYEEVEAAIKMAMMKYPQRIDNTEEGIFETDYVRGEGRFKSPYSPKKTEPSSNGYRYRILIRIVKVGSGEKARIKVQVVKQMELARDFFSDPDSIASDGLEESVILYRIARELAVARVLQKATDRAAEKNRS